MTKYLPLALCSLIIPTFAVAGQKQSSQSSFAKIGQEISIERHLEDGEEFQISLSELIEHGRHLFAAKWTRQEGAGRPLTKGTGSPLADTSDPLMFPRNFNRISGPDSNSCAGCHNAPFGMEGGGGDIVTNVFVLGQRFDFATFDPEDEIPTKGSVDEGGMLSTLQSIANERATVGMFGSGYVEMLARQITEDLQSIRNLTPPGGSRALASKGISFGTISRLSNGTWDTSAVEGIPAVSLTSSGSADPPSLIIRPFHQAGRVVSLREFSNNAFNHHHGIQTSERFGAGADPDGDGFVDEMTRADTTAVTVFQATLPVPGRVIPRDEAIEQAVLIGESKFQGIGCATCHVPNLPLDREAWIFREPNPFNPPGNLQVGEVQSYAVDLTDKKEFQPVLKQEKRGVVFVPIFSDFKLHDICDGPDDPNVEGLDMNQPAGSDGFFAGNRKFLTRRLWGMANEAPYFHHGKFTTIREAILAHAGEALDSRARFEGLSEHERNCIVEFLKTLQVLPPGTKDLIVDERGHEREWPPKRSGGDGLKDKKEKRKK